MRGRRLLRIGGGASFGGRVLIACLISTVVALVLFAGSAFVYEGQSSEAHLREQLSSLARILAVTNKQGMSLAELGLGGAAFEADKTAFRETLHEDERVTGGALVHKSGDLYLAYPEDLKLESFLRQEPLGGELSADGTLWIHQPVFLDGEEIGSVTLQGSREVLRERRVRYLFLLVGATLLSTLLSVLITNRLRNSLTQPITDMIRTTNQVTESKDYSLRVNEGGDGELLDLAAHINHMLSSINERDNRLSQSEQAVRELNDSLNDKNKELETIIYVTSHDLRSPLVNIQGFGKELQAVCEELAELLKQGKGADSPEIQRILECDITEALSFIGASSAKMGALLSGLLRLSRLGSSAIAPQTIDVNQMFLDIRRTFEFQLQEHQIELHCTELDSCYGDPIQVNQAFSNLLDNAIKYTAIKFPSPSAAAGEHGRIEVSCSTLGGQVVYSVRDNGVGIAPEYQQKVFEVFHRLDPSLTAGEGLGLSITQRMVKRNGGSIRVESKAGEGATFFLSLPSARMTGRDGASSREEAPPRSV